MTHVAAVLMVTGDDVIAAKEHIVTLLSAIDDADVADVSVESTLETTIEGVSLTVTLRFPDSKSAGSATKATEDALQGALPDKASIEAIYIVATQ